MKRATRSKELARQRALIRSLMERSPLGQQPAVAALFGRTDSGAALPRPGTAAKIIPFPDLRREA